MSISPTISLPKVPSPSAVASAARDYAASTPILPSPPRRGGDVERGEVAALKELQELRTPADDAWARRLDATGTTSAWDAHARQLRKERGLGASVLLDGTIAAATAVSRVEQGRHDRTRPSDAHASIQAIVPGNAPSYPSDHAAGAYAAAALIATLNPQQKDDAYQLAHEVGVSRMYGGANYPTDVAAGAAIGTAIGTGVGHGALAGADIAGDVKTSLGRISLPDVSLPDVSLPKGPIARYRDFQEKMRYVRVISQL